MKKPFYLCAFVLLTFSQCQPSQQDTANEGTEAPDSLTTEVSNYAVVGSEPFKQALASLRVEPQSSRKALELFQLKYISEDKSENDQALLTYLEFQRMLLDSLNSNLGYMPHFEAINSLVWADSTEWQPEGIAFAKELKTYGIELKFTEGTPYLDSDPDLAGEYFNSSLTEATKEYYQQFSKETKEGFASDAGIVISLEALADRVGFWDEFLKKNPGNLFSENAKASRDSYLYYLFAGMENTPAFDYETQKISEEYVKAYQYFLAKYPQAASSNDINTYLELLKKSGYKRTEEITSFIESKSQY